MDDCSTDNSKEVIIKEFGGLIGKKIIYVRNQENMERSYTRIRGVEVSKGEYVFFLDRIVAVDRATFERLKEDGLFPEKLVYIPSGLDLSRFKPMGKEMALAKRRELGIDPNKKGLYKRG